MITREVLIHLCSAFLAGYLCLDDFITMFGLEGNEEKKFTRLIVDYFEVWVRSKYMRGTYDYKKDGEDFASLMLEYLKQIEKR